MKLLRQFSFFYEKTLHAQTRQKENKVQKALKSTKTC